MPELLKGLVSWKSFGTEREMRREIGQEDRYDYLLITCLLGNVLKLCAFDWLCWSRRS